MAARLTGWRIDIKSENEKRQEVEAQFDDLEEDEGALTLPGLTEAQLIALSEAGLDTADRLLEVETARLAEIAGVDDVTAVELQAAVREQVDAVEREAAEAAPVTEAETAGETAAAATADGASESEMTDQGTSTAD